jgi:hypothetical protein
MKLPNLSTGPAAWLHSDPHYRRVETGIAADGRNQAAGIAPSGECGCSRNRHCVGPCVLGSCLGSCVPNI